MTSPATIRAAVLRDGFQAAHPAMTRRKVTDLIGEANELSAMIRAARDEAIRLGSDPLANPAALRRAKRRLAYLNGVGHGWANVVGASVKARRDAGR